MSKTIDVFLLAENRLLREALTRLLGKKNELRVVGADAYSPAALEEITNAQPQILLLDSNGLASANAMLVSSLQSSIRDLRIVMIDMESDEDTFLRAVRAGVVGYVLKDASALEVAAIIRAVATGEAVCPPSLSMVLFRSIARQPSVAVSLPYGSDLGLSRREQQMVELLRQRLTNKEIASKLNLSEQTVKNHVHHILRKTGMANRASIVRLCETGTSQEGYANPGARLA